MRIWVGGGGGSYEVVGSPPPPPPPPTPTHTHTYKVWFYWKMSPQILVCATAKWKMGGSGVWKWGSPELTVGRVWLALWPAANPGCRGAVLCVRAGCSNPAMNNLYVSPKSAGSLSRKSQKSWWAGGGGGGTPSLFLDLKILAAIFT